MIKGSSPRVKRHTVDIQKVVTGGHGLARLADGLVVMVPFVLPGETVVVSIAKQHKGFAEAVLLEVLQPAPQRVEPVCPSFMACGGCHLQHGDYPSQLAIKEAILLDLLARQRLLPTATLAAVCQPIMAAPSPLHYRQRIRLQVDSNGRLGFFAARSHAVVEVASCPLAAAELNQVLSELRRLAAWQKLAQQAVAVELLLSPLSGQVEVIVHLGRRPRAADQQAAKALAADLKLVQAVWLAAEGCALSGPSAGAGPAGLKSTGLALALPEDLGDRPLVLRFEAGGFCQVNHQQNERLIRQLLAWAEVGPKDRVLDLFCGMGNFSLPLAGHARQVVGTDLQRSSIRGASANARANGLTNCVFQQAVAVDAVREFKKAAEPFDLILLDPPRSGCREILPYLPDLGAAKIIYISCDPATMIRDLVLLQGHGFGLHKLHGIDMFPQTCHLESMALLRRD